MMMLKTINWQAFKDDLRKLALACLIGGLTGLFLGPHREMLSLGGLLLFGLTLWYLGLRRGNRND